MKTQESNELQVSLSFPVTRELMVINPEGNHKGRALVVQDDKCLQRVLPISLSMAGYRAVVAGSGHEALEKLQASPFDIVFTDLIIPGSWTLPCHIKKHIP